jgi:hypothetical protein
MELRGCRLWRWDDWRWDERRGRSLCGVVDSLNVPTSPVPHVPRHRTGHIRGLVSTERTQPHRGYAPAFLAIEQDYILTELHERCAPPYGGGRVGFLK